MNNDTLIPFSRSDLVIPDKWSILEITSRPPSVVLSNLFSGTIQTVSGVCLKAISNISLVAAISNVIGFCITSVNRTRSKSEICRRSSRKCTTILSAPAETAIQAALIGSG